jgi:hypothetical protein
MALLSWGLVGRWISGRGPTVAQVTEKLNCASKGPDRIMPGQILYSTNTRLKHIINVKFRNDVHYVWCGDCFDSQKVAAYSLQALTAPSSDPCAIYNQLSAECQRMDRHSAKISQQKLSLTQRAAAWEADGSITGDEAAEIVYMVENAGPAEWKPLLYVIPRAIVTPRLQLVPIANRASFGNEYVIPDLSGAEFDIVELS